MNFKHGHARKGKHSDIYERWYGIIQRCRPSSKSPVNKFYYGRGIRVCREWKTFEVFKEWAINNGYAKYLQIDRIDNRKGYSPGNCRWVTRKQNMRNMTSNRRLRFRGETKSLVEWAEHLGISRYTLSGRLQKGWTVQKALTEPIDIKKRNKRSCV